MATSLITAQTAAKDSDQITVGGLSPYKVGEVAIVGWGFSTDTADIQISYNGGTNFIDLYIGGTQIQMSDTKNYYLLPGPGVYRVQKGITTGTVGFALSNPFSP